MTFFAPLLSGLGTGVGMGFMGGLFGGGSRSSGSSGPSAADYVTLYGAQLAAGNNPLTAEMQRLSVLQGSTGGALGLQGSNIASGQLSILADLLQQGQASTRGQASEAAELTNAGIASQGLLNQARLGTELLGAQFAGQAGAEALSGQNELARNIASTNLGLRSLQEQARINAADIENRALADAFRTRATTAGQLALGAQQLQSNLQLNEARTLSDLTRTQAATRAQMGLETQRFARAMGAQRFFA